MMLNDAQVPPSANESLAGDIVIPGQLRGPGVDMGSSLLIQNLKPSDNLSSYLVGGKG